MRGLQGTAADDGERGFTLIEVLLAIAIIAMVAGSFAGGLCATTQTAHVRELLSQLKTLDANARLHALSEGPLTLSVIDGRLVLATESRVVATLGPGAGVRVMLRAAQREESVRFDRLGASPDYEVSLACEGGSVTLRVSGLSGLGAEGATSP